MKGSGTALPASAKTDLSPGHRCATGRYGLPGWCCSWFGTAPAARAARHPRTAIAHHWGCAGPAAHGRPRPRPPAGTGSRPTRVPAVAPGSGGLRFPPQSARRSCHQARQRKRQRQARGIEGGGALAFDQGGVERASRKELVTTQRRRRPHWCAGPPDAWRPSEASSRASAWAQFSPQTMSLAIIES